MRKILPGLFACLALALILNSQAMAHTLYMTVEDNENGTVTVQGMFSTGATGAGIEVRLEDEKGKVLWKGKTDADGECIFKNRACLIPLSWISDRGRDIRPGRKDRKRQMSEVRSQKSKALKRSCSA